MCYAIDKHPSSICGDSSCHPERSEGSGLPKVEILSAAKDDRKGTSQVCSRQALSPNVCVLQILLSREVKEISKINVLHFTVSQLVPIDKRELSCQYRMENLVRQQKIHPYSKQPYFMLLTLLALAGFTALFVRQGMMARGARAKSNQLAQRQTQVDGGSYLLYTV